jgi:hypothetical protein
LGGGAERGENPQPPCFKSLRGNIFMKAILEFNLPDDEDMFRLANNGASAHFALAEIKEYLRQKIKYSELTEEQYNIYEDLRDAVCKIIEDNELSI